ncbi:amino acid ABC transporter permease [Micromonospora sp. NPDC000089]|uniref:amino acid ABC transporter permease n=1 Tax=unclassified Micromonospora TaxID=2617518 RepID=UPI0036A25229
MNETSTRDGASRSAPRDVPPAGATLPVRPLRHPWRWVCALVVLTIAAALLSSLLKNPNVNWPVVREYLFAPVTLKGIVVTLYLTALAMVIGIVGGTAVAIMRLSTNPVLSGLARAFIWFFRGTPVLVQIIFWGYLGALYPTLQLGIPFTDVVFLEGRTSDIITPFLAATLALGLNEVAYAAEIVRGGISSVDRGQTEAALSLAMTPAATTRRVVLPQAMRVIIPPMGNEVITMLKTTALVSVIAGQDLMTNLQRIYSQNYQVIPLLVVAALWYLALTTLLSVPQAWLERRFGRGHLAAAPSMWSRLLGIAARRPAKEA